MPATAARPRASAPPWRASLVLAARHYRRRFAAPPPCRFDVVAIDNHELLWLRAAFDAA